MKHCIIFCAAGFDGLLEPIPEGALVIAADGGLRHTERLGLRPHVILGDFDSLGYIPADSTVFPVEKDDTDSMLAVRLLPCSYPDPLVSIYLTRSRIAVSPCRISLCRNSRGFRLEAHAWDVATTNNYQPRQRWRSNRRRHGVDLIRCFYSCDGSARGRDYDGAG